MEWRRLASKASLVRVCRSPLHTRPGWSPDKPSAAALRREPVCIEPQKASLLHHQPPSTNKVSQNGDDRTVEPHEHREVAGQVAPRTRPLAVPVTEVDPRQGGRGAILQQLGSVSGAQRVAYPPVSAHHALPRRAAVAPLALRALLALRVRRLAVALLHSVSRGPRWPRTTRGGAGGGRFRVRHRATAQVAQNEILVWRTSHLRPEVDRRDSRVITSPYSDSRGGETKLGSQGDSPSTISGMATWHLPDMPD